MSDVLMTGGTGLIGSRMLRRFVDAGVAVRGLVRPGRDLPDGAIRVEGDILDPASLEEAVVGVSAVVHLAASFRTRNEEETWLVNDTGTKNLVTAVQRYAPTARFLMASTSNVYDDDDAGRPARESDEIHPVLAYPASKARAEQTVRDSGLNWAIIRLPFVYGDGDGHIENSIPLLREFGWHPAQKLSLGHHEDIATAFEIGLTGRFDGRIVNIADESPLTAYELAQLIGEDYGSSTEPLNNPWKGHVDVSLARSLGYTPRLRTAYQAAQEHKL